MKNISLITILLLLLTSSSNCIKSGSYTPTLPPATQEGKNTCGFLVNGKVWLPKGDNGFPNLSCDYDETFMGGHLMLPAIGMKMGQTIQQISELQAIAFKRQGYIN
jgi:hypothetical protein